MCVLALEPAARRREVKAVTDPDGRVVQYTYRPDGKLATITSPQGVRSLTYNSSTGLTASMSDSDGSNLAFTYDGFLHTGTAWSGTGRPSGQVTQTYDTAFRVDLLKVNGATIADYSYDSDGLVVGTGGLSIARSSASGDALSTVMDTVTTNRSTNRFSEVDDYSVTACDSLGFCTARPPHRSRCSTATTL
ncbi:MAG: hypothetical protein RL701_2467 [Pseudomonadota bacterium]